MSLFSIIGVVLFVMICFTIKNAILPHLSSKGFKRVNQEGQEVIAPVKPANYRIIIAISIVGFVFLMFIAVAIIELKDFSLFGKYIKI